jgi:hypothetical protein
MRNILRTFYLSARWPWAIYELDGDAFRDCIGLEGKERPKEFTAKQGTGYVLITYKMVK